MFQLAQSPFLQALGFAIINSLWQFAFLWLIYIVVNSLIKFSSPQKYATALTLHIAGFTWFTGTLIFYYNQCQQAAVNFSETSVGFIINAGSFSSTSFKDIILTVLYRAEYFLPYLSVAYIILIVFLAIKTINCYRNTQLLRTTGLQKINVEWRLFVQQLSYQLGIKKAVKIYISDLVSSPITLGFFKPLILLPLATITNLNTQQIEAVLLHELAHIKRHDYGINLILSIIEISLFFNPFMQLMSRHIKRERENSCDDWVLQYNYNATSYAKALLTIASNKSKISSHLAMSATSDNRALLFRVKRMIEKKELSFNYRQHLIALVFIAGIFSSITWLSPSRHNFSATKSTGVIRKVQAQPIVAKVNNPLFNPVFFLVDGDKKKVEIYSKREAQQIEEPVVEINSSVANEDDIPKANEVIINDVMPIAQELPAIKINDKINAKSFSIDSINQIISKSLFNKAVASINFRKIENDILKSKFEIEAAKGNNYKKLENLHKQINDAVAQLKKLNLQLSNGVLKVVYTQKNTDKYPSAQLDEQLQLKIIDGQKLAAELNKNLAELQKESLFLRTRVDDADLDESTNVESPCDSSPTPSPSTNENNNWSYSYQYAESPAIKSATVTSPASKSKAVSVEIKRIQEVKEEKQTINLETPQPAKAVTIKRNRVVRI